MLCLISGAEHGGIQAGASVVAIGPAGDGRLELVVVSGAFAPFREWALEVNELSTGLADGDGTIGGRRELGGELEGKALDGDETIGEGVRRELGGELSAGPLDGDGTIGNSAGRRRGKRADKAQRAHHQ
jgi:hypothetical protein